MSIILFLGRDVNEYNIVSGEKIKQALTEGRFRCEQCLRAIRRHSSYDRNVCETGDKLEITVVWCRKCKIWHALLPDFLLQNKHYSGNEIESVIIDSESTPAIQIDTKASESTVRRWIAQIGNRIRQAVSKLKYRFGQRGQAVSEAKIDVSHCYSELEQILQMAPQDVRYSGNKLGLANIWLGTTGTAAYI